MSKTTGIILGIVMIVIGLALATFGFISFFGASNSMNPESFSPSGVFISAGLGIVLILVGVILIIGGSLIIYLANIGKIFRYVAKETAPAIETSTRALGKGITSGIKAGLKE